MGGGGFEIASFAKRLDKSITCKITFARVRSMISSS